MTPSQVRMARAGLNWSAIDLAAAARLSPNTILNYETGKPVSDITKTRIRQALAAAGVVFAGDIGVSLRDAPPSAEATT